MTEAAREDFRQAILAVEPELAKAPMTARNAGFDSAAVEAGDYLFKFPKNAGAEKSLRMEATILAMVRSHVELSVPDLVLHEGPPLMSQHRLIPGAHLLREEYPLLDEAARERLAKKLATLHAQLHAIPAAEAEAAGAGPVEPWLPAAEIRARGSASLPSDIITEVLDPVLDAFEALSPDDIVYGYFDGHGWNMAFDHERHELNGVYDFADSGFGPRHQDLGYSAFVSPDLTRRIVQHYQSVTGIAVDLNRVLILHGTLRLWEFAAVLDDGNPEHFRWMLESLERWAGFLRGNDPV